jgi:putative FmdB family regulatory protein
MPLYEYRCESCGHTFEIIQRFSDPPVEMCPVCAGAVQKLLSAPAIQFKGSGWYVTDYPKKGSLASESAEKAGESGTSKETTTAKPAEKTESGAASGSSNGPTRTK